MFCFSEDNIIPTLDVVFHLFVEGLTQLTYNDVVKID